jgi:hypothetical protein
MRKTSSALTVLVFVLGVALAGATPAPARASVAVHVDIGFFYDALAPYGSWVTLARYGDVWLPDVPPWWRPYSDGRWAYTDDGWAWVDNEPWGWAVFHYGRWAFDGDYGWVWVPGDVWAPAWVAWRFGDGYIGWAPLPPEIGWQTDFGLAFANADLDDVIAPHFWCFVDERHFAAPSVRTYLAPAARNVTFVRITRNITHYSVVHNRVIDRGVNLRQVERATGRSLPRLRIVPRRAPGPGRVSGRELNIYRPSFSGEPGRWRGGHVTPSSRRRPAVAPQVLERRHREQLRQLEVRNAQERARLQRLQREDSARRFHGVKREELQRRHQAELQALARQQQRERQVLERRLRRDTRPVRSQRKPPARPKGKGHSGHGHG